ncbi:pyridoxamine 5'-phosphate oxidase family protein [Lachnospiraceae bacterium ZAX-1]
MSKLSNEVKKFLGENGIWVFATCSDKPNAGPVFFKKIDEQDNIILFDIFMNKRLENLAKNSNVSLTVFNAQTSQGYQICGTATYSTDAALVKEGNEQSGKMNLTTKGAVVIKAEDVYVQTPGPDVGKKL